MLMSTSPEPEVTGICQTTTGMKDADDKYSQSAIKQTKLVHPQNCLLVTCFISHIRHITHFTHHNSVYWSFGTLFSPCKQLYKAFYGWRVRHVKSGRRCLCIGQIKNVSVTLLVYIMRRLHCLTSLHIFSHLVTLTFCLMETSWRSFFQTAKPLTVSNWCKQEDAFHIWDSKHICSLVDI